MRIHIGIITARGSLQNIQEVDEPMREKCDITYLPYSTSVELTNLYLENVKRFDGILFSGAYPYNYLAENVCLIAKPYRYLELEDRDFYRLIARLLARQPDIDFSRVVFDAYTVGGNMQSLDKPIFEDIFTPEQHPQISNIISPFFFSQNLNTIYDATMEAYREHWKSGKIDLFVTRLTNLSRQMKAEGIPHILIQPSPATIMDCFDKLLADIQAARAENSLTACCLIQIAHTEPSEDEFSLLKKTLDRFNSEQNVVFVLRQNGELFNVVTSSAAVRELTDQYSTCLLTSYLSETLPFSTYIGWGIGFDIVTAHQNALRALHESARDARRYTYLINESEEMIGPLCGDRTISYQLHPSARTNRLAKVLGISAINLEKLISLQKKKHITEFTASDLVFYLDITPRSATRILQKLVEYGAATQIDSLHLNSRGRPAALYKIDLIGISLP